MNQRRIVQALTVVLLLIGVRALIVVGEMYFHDELMLGKHFVETIGMLGPLAYVAVYTVAVICLVPGSALTLLGGAIFGPVLGTAYTVLGASLGAYAAFLIARWAGRPFAKGIVKKGGVTLARYDRGIERNGFMVGLLLRLVPLFPFSLSNYALGLTRMKFRDYALSTVIGIIPGTFAYAYLGGSIFMLSPWHIGGAIAVLLLVSLGAHFLKKKYSFVGISKEKVFDLIVIGAGSGGLNIAGFGNRIGLRVLLIDREDTRVGGDCLNFGCIPSKALIHAARMVSNARSAAAYGLSVTGNVEWNAVVAHIKNAQESIRAHENADYFRKKGMTVVLGDAAFASERSVMVNGEEYFGRKIIIATGSVPRNFAAPGIESVQVLNNENVFTMPHLPKRIVILGGGPIGIEIGQALSMLGSHITVVAAEERILPKEDAEIAQVLYERLVAEGMEFHFNATIDRFENQTAIVKDNNGAEHALSLDALFVAIGRIPDVESLMLSKGQIEVNEKGGIMVDAHLHTSNPNVFVVGDAAGNYQFTHAAEVHAGVVVRNLLSPFGPKFNPSDMAWVTFTAPEIATFGLSESELKKQGIAYERLVTSFGDDDRAVTDGYQYGKSVLLVGKSGELWGGSMVAPNAGELVQELILAKKQGIPLPKLFDRVYPYPTATRINRKAAGEYLSRRITSQSSRLLRAVFRYR